MVEDYSSTYLKDNQNKKPLNKKKKGKPLNQNTHIIKVSSYLSKNR